MIAGRCNLLPTVRYVLDVSKKQFSYCQLKGGQSTRSHIEPFGRAQICRLGQNSSGFIATFARMATSASEESSGQSSSTPPSKNRLAFEKSPYLLQHASNPVEWHPWGDEAFEKAKKENKVIFLSVGYSTCHWCHVMEHESFENPEIAKIMNCYFVNIKVDREERPDVDRIYMTFIQNISGHGGWPMSVFLTPDLKPITGGTYFPPEQKYGVPGFKQVLLAVAHKWTESKSELLHVGSDILKTLKLAVESDENTNENSVPLVDCARRCAQQLTRKYDSVYGGFSSAPKFPQAVNFNFLFHLYSRNPKGEMEKDCLDMCLHTLTMLAKGGIHDHIGQGFSRYSVDGKWHVPHFEKMLYDQAQLLRSYSEAYLASKEPFYAEVVDDIVMYATRDLRHKEGGFFSAEDADSYPDKDSSQKKEGAFYVWSYEELKALLNTPAAGSDKITQLEIFCYHYGVLKEGNVPRAQDPHGELTGQNVLIVNSDIEDTAKHFNLKIEDVKVSLNDARKILFDARQKRPRPHLDDKIITAWNGLMISGLARAGVALERKEYINYAVDAAKFIERHLIDESSRKLLRSCYRGDGDVITQTSVPIAGFHVDYAFLVKGLLDLYEACFDSHWLELAERLQDMQDELFWDGDKGGYFASTGTDPTIILRLKDDQDGAEPSSNSIACENLLRLAAYMDRNDLSEKAACLLRLFGDMLEKIPIATPQLVSALLNYHDSITQIHIVGKLGADDTNALLRIVQQRLIPGKIVLVVDHEQPGNILFRKNEVVGKMKPQKGLATAYVCRHHTCSLPVNNPDDLAVLLEDEQRK